MIRETKDGRRLLKGRDYAKFRRDVWTSQNGACLVCHAQTSLLADIDLDFSAHLSHRGSRGMGSGIRDDRVGNKRGQVEGILCGKCHREIHHQGYSR